MDGTLILMATDMEVTVDMAEDGEAMAVAGEATADTVAFMVTAVHMVMEDTEEDMVVVGDLIEIATVGVDTAVAGVATVWATAAMAWVDMVEVGATLTVVMEVMVGEEDTSGEYIPTNH